MFKRRRQKQNKNKNKYKSNYINILNKMKQNNIMFGRLQRYLSNPDDIKIKKFVDAFGMQI